MVRATPTDAVHSRARSRTPAVRPAQSNPHRVVAVGPSSSSSTPETRAGHSTAAESSTSLPFPPPPLPPHPRDPGQHHHYKKENKSPLLLLLRLIKPPCGGGQPYDQTRRGDRPIHSTDPPPPPPPPPPPERRRALPCTLINPAELRNLLIARRPTRQAYRLRPLLVPCPPTSSLGGKIPASIPGPSGGLLFSGVC